MHTSIEFVWIANLLHLGYIIQIECKQSVASIQSSCTIFQLPHHKSKNEVRYTYTLAFNLLLLLFLGSSYWERNVMGISAGKERIKWVFIMGWKVVVVTARRLLIVVLPSSLCIFQDASKTLVGNSPDSSSRIDFFCSCYGTSLLRFKCSPHAGDQNRLGHSCG